MPEVVNVGMVLSFQFAVKDDEGNLFPQQQQGIPIPKPSAEAVHAAFLEWGKRRGALEKQLQEEMAEAMAEAGVPPPTRQERRQAARVKAKQAEKAPANGKHAAKAEQPVEVPVKTG